MLKLKDYQERTLAKLTAFLDKARILDAKRSFTDLQDAQGYRSTYKEIKELEGVP